MDRKQLEALSVIGKKCEFCGKNAFSGEIVAGGGAIYWCFDCGVEYGRILAELVQAERPDLLQRGKEANSFLTFCSDADLRTWSMAASRKAAQILRERRQQSSS